MDSLELLNVLDVIKNQETYNRRISELKAAEEAVRNIKYVDVTMAQADKLRTEASALKEQAEENLRCIEEEVESRVKTERDKFKEELSKIDAERKKLELFTHKLEEEQKTLFKTLQANKQTTEDLRERGNELSIALKQTNSERLKLAYKVDQINKIFNKDS